MLGKVTLVGAGPGGKALLTLGGAEAIRHADAVVYDRLVGDDILDLIPRDAKRVNVGKENRNHPVPQQEINDLLVRLAQAGNNTVRLKGGDCFLFGRGGEECEYLHAHHIPFEVIPGVTSALAVPAYAGIPVTHRDYASSVHIVAAHAKAGSELNINFEGLVKLDATLVFLMGLTTIEKLMDGLIGAGLPPDTPSAVIENGTCGNQRKVMAHADKLAAKVRAFGFQSPALIVVGRVCKLSQQLDWFTPLPLHGKTIVVTRPRERAGTLANRLRALGADVVEAPCIEIRELADIQPLEDAIAFSYDWAVFTSPAGVYCAVRALRRAGRDLRALYGMKIAAIGRGTADTLTEYGLTADLVPAQYNSDALAAALLTQLPQDGAVLLLRAKEGGKDLPRRLLDAGIVVADVPLYETLLVCDKAEQLKALLTEGKVDYVTFTSVSTVHGFTNSLPGVDFSGFTALCIGKQTESAALACGMHTVIAQNATMDDLIACLLEREMKV